MLNSEDVKVIDLVEYLDPSPEKRRKYVCPVCGGGNLGIGKNGFTCYSSNCDPKEIFKAAKKLAGLWVEWGKSNDEDDAAIEERRNKARRDREKREREKRETIAKLPSIPARHERISKALRAGKLSKSDRNILKNRGMSDHAIDHFGFYSHPDGIVGVVRDLDGRYTMQYMRRHDNDPRYKPLPNQAWGITNSAACQLPLGHVGEGYMPLNHCVPSDVQNLETLYISEGDIIKPQIASERFKAVCIGCGGGKGKDALQGQLEAAIEHYRPKTIRILPDAGYAENSGVQKFLKALIDICSKFAPTYTGDWGQAKDKSVGNIDDISDELFNTIRWHRQGDYSLDFASETVWQDWKTAHKQIEFDPEYSPSDVVLKAKLEGFNGFIFNGVPGSGKSHSLEDLASALLDKKFIDKHNLPIFSRVIYLHPNHRNPTTKYLEQNYIDIPSRHDGLKVDPDRKTPLGTPHKTRLKPGEKLTKKDIQPNCEYTHLFHNIRQKNPTAQTGKICKQCPARMTCSYIADKNEVFSPSNNYQLLRGHIDQFDKFENGDLVVIDEAETVLKSSIAFEASKQDLLSELMALQDAQESPGAYEDIDPRSINEAVKIANQLIQIIRNLSTTTPTHGHDHTVFYEALKAAEIKGSYESYRGVFERILQPQIGVLFNDSLSLHSGESLIANKYHANILGKLFDCLSNEAINVRIQGDSITVTEPDFNHAEKLLNAGFVLLMTATPGNPEILSKRAGMPELPLIRPISPTFGNLYINHLIGGGEFGRHRRTGTNGSAGSRADRLYSKLSEPSILQTKRIDFKEHAQRYWYRDNRATNEFERDVNRIVAFGIPTPNLGAVQADLQATTGKYHAIDSPYFKAHLHDLISGELIQLVGRLRAQRRSHQELEVYLVADGFATYLEDIAATYPGCIVKATPIAVIEPSACFGGDSHIGTFLELIASSIASGKKISGKAITAETGVKNPQETLKRALGYGLGVLKNSHKCIYQLYTNVRKINPESFLIENPDLKDAFVIAKTLWAGLSGFYRDIIARSFGTTEACLSELLGRVKVWAVGVATRDDWDEYLDYCESGDDSDDACLPSPFDSAYWGDYLEHCDSVSSDGLLFEALELGYLHCASTPHWLL